MSRRSGRSKPYEEPLPEDEEVNHYESEGDDERDEQEITRCVCGEDELNPNTISTQLLELLSKEYHIKIDHGLFIQCDKCSVWQHGYCVGLFTNEEVPDKYWCENCKPELHVFITENNTTARTLYKPVNDKRKRLLSDAQQSNKRQRAKRLTSAVPDPKHRKERRHFDDYDEQLKKALRESAKEVGLVDKKPTDPEEEPEVQVEDIATDVKNEEEEDAKPKTEPEVPETETNENGSNIEEDLETVADRKRKAESRKVKSRSKVSKPKRTKVNDSKTDAPATTMSKDELISQASKPRFVGDKSSIYELRKRTGAILEWLGRSQLELEEDKANKMELFNYKEIDVDLDDESKKVIHSFKENLKLMEHLTEKILDWEERFGKYAP